MKKGFQLEDSKGRKLRWDCHTLIQVAKSLKGQPPYSVFMPVDGADSSLWNTSEFAEPAYSHLVSALEQEPDDFIFSEMLEPEDSIGPPYQKTWVLVNVPRVISSLESKISELRHYDPGRQFPGSAHYDTELRHLKRRYRDGLPDVIDLFVFFGTEAVLTKLQKAMPSREDSPLATLFGRAGIHWGQIAVQFLEAQRVPATGAYSTTKLKFIFRENSVLMDALSIPEFTRKNTRPLRTNTAYEFFLILANFGGRVKRSELFNLLKVSKETDLEAAKEYRNLQKQKEALSAALKSYNKHDPAFELKMTLALLDENGDRIRPRRL